MLNFSSNVVYPLLSAEVLPRYFGSISVIIFLSDPTKPFVSFFLKVSLIDWRKTLSYESRQSWYEMPVGPPSSYLDLIASNTSQEFESTT